MRIRSLVLFAAVAMLVIACDGGDAELSTGSTLVSGPTTTQASADSTTTVPDDDDSSPGTTLVGQAVSGYEVVARIPNDNGEELHVVIPNGAYTDVDLENFVIDLIETNADLYGAEIFDNEAAAVAFAVPEADRTEEETALLERHHFVSLTGRDRIDFHGPFSDFPGGAIGS
ncbi:MAG: hypothetical protein ACRDU9_05865 [Acidimicrobiia bacterium]